MPRIFPIQTNFNGGEISVRAQGRFDLERYATSLRKCENFLPSVTGPLVRRPGTRFVSEVKDSSKKVRLIPFEFSTVQAYILEFGDLYIRFYRNNAQITDLNATISGATQANPVVITATAHGFSNGDRVFVTGVVGMTELNNREFIVANKNVNDFEIQDAQTGTNVDGTGYTAYSSAGDADRVYEIVSPYDEDDLEDLDYTQSADILYIAHPDFEVRKLTRTGHTAWTISTFEREDGPYLPLNTTDTTLVPSAVSSVGATVTITASAVTGINQDQGFQAADVGRMIRYKDGGQWGWYEITVINSTTSVDATVKAVPGAATTSVNWRLGIFKGGEGFPRALTFHEQRLWMGGSSSNPSLLIASETSNFESFAPSDNDDTITDTHSLTFALDSNQVNVINWLLSDEKGLLVGTAGAVWAVRASRDLEAVTPTNVNAQVVESAGVADVKPVIFSKGAMFVQRAKKKVTELTFFFEVNGYRITDLTILHPDVSGTSVTEMAVQAEPIPLLWVVRADGELLALSYLRDIESLRSGWSRHILGGQSDAAGTKAKVKSVTSVIANDQTYVEVWVVVERHIDGATHQYVEYFTNIPDPGDDPKDMVYMDSVLSLDSPVTITNATQAKPVVITAASHGFSNDDEVVISDIVGMTQLNGNVYTIANKTTNTFELNDSNGSDIDGTNYSAYVSGGEVRKRETNITGLNHLEGESVDILGDGAVQNSKTVSAGAVTLDVPAALIHIGLHKPSDAQLLRGKEGAVSGAALGKTRGTFQITFLLDDSADFKVGEDFSNLLPVTVRKASEVLGKSPSLFSGVFIYEKEFDIDFDNFISIRQDVPLPLNILAISPHMDVDEDA